MSHARIRLRSVVMKAGANVIPLRGASVHNERKANFVNYAGRCFDIYAERHGAEPDAMVMVLGGLKQAANVFWTIQGDSEGGGTTMLSFAAAAITREIVDPS